MGNDQESIRMKIIRKELEILVSKL